MSKTLSLGVIAEMTIFFQSYDLEALLYVPGGPQSAMPAN